MQPNSEAQLGSQLRPAHLSGSRDDSFVTATAERESVGQAVEDDDPRFEEEAGELSEFGEEIGPGGVARLCCWRWVRAGSSIPRCRA